MDAATLNRLLQTAVEHGASDIHLKVGDPPLFRLKSLLQPQEYPKLTYQDTRDIAQLLLPYGLQEVDLDQAKELDFSYSLPGTARFRVNVYRQRGTLAVVMRVVPFEVPGFQDLGLPEGVRDFTLEERGLVLVTGVTGSGKSTTLAALINEINRSRRKHIITIEDPIEFLFRSDVASITQREIGADTRDFATALRAALRQDPDIIMVGEMRDTETIDVALKAAETGHLVFSTLHTPDAPKTINRLVSVFPLDQQRQVRIRLAESMRGIVSQRLLPRADGRGAVVAVEVMKTTMTISDCIRDENKTHLIRDYIVKGAEQYRMQTFDQHLTDLYLRGIITLEVALGAATNPSDFERALRLGQESGPAEVGEDVTVVASSEGTQTHRLDRSSGFGRFGGDPVFDE
ncbi:MAG: type IV pilus twitching motility protein PilT [Nitrospirae bacterium]|nr:MAG: type IV pilus twitching motility protein PilT [Nitrospirota bacterium]